MGPPAGAPGLFIRHRDDEVHDALAHARTIAKGEPLTVSLAVEGREIEPGAHSTM